MENKTTQVQENREMTPFSYCEICGAAIPDIDESWYSCRHVNEEGYLCRQCVKAAIEQAYPEWATHKTHS